MASADRPFLSLPNEIRDRIYGYVLTVNVDDSSPFITPLNSDLRPQPMRPSCLAILATCRQVLFEAFHVFYASNTFNFDNRNQLCSFLRAIGSVRASEIRSIRCSLKLAARQNERVRFVLSKLIRLEKLSFQFNKETLQEWPHIFPNVCSPKAFTKFRGLREVTFITVNDTELNESERDRMQQYRDEMMASNPKRKKKSLPETVDVFGGLKLRKQRDPTVARRLERKEEIVACTKA